MTRRVAFIEPVSSLYSPLPKAVIKETKGYSSTHNQCVRCEFPTPRNR